MFRRWYVALPLVVITVLLSGWAYTTVKPDYKGVGYVQLIPPQAATNTKNTELRNVWLDTGLQSLLQAANYATIDKSFLKELGQRGLSENVVLDMGYPAPTLTVTVIGTSEGQVMATMDAVMQRFQETVKVLQTDQGVTDIGLISSRRLDNGQNLEETGGKVKRALIAVLGAGLLATAGLTIGFDAWMRTRTRRKQSAAVKSEPTPDPHDPGGDPTATAIIPTAATVEARAPIVPRILSSNGTSIKPAFDAQQDVEVAAMRRRRSGGRRETDVSSSEVTIILPRNATVERQNGSGSTPR
ncbi:hypothetical protein [Virgisporangium aliadipatigenens]|uniref:hypothetical protein n=1 Tax=Virgisporangium aliadipatigenens TaxID=741659 RepID=UPI001945702B|nr:hypothetical protein [Virgisporangium aliadipatigenens]